jgi:hypothetical protein
MKKLFALAACSALMLTTGCTSFVKASGDNKVATSIVVKTFGVCVGVAPENSTPKVTLGWQITEVNFLPLSTNGPINSPNLGITQSLKNNAGPFTFDGSDSFAAGQYQTAEPNTNSGINSQPIVPK